jgi:hypothetical protein
MLLTFVTRGGITGRLRLGATRRYATAAFPAELNTGFDWTDENALRHGELPDVPTDEATMKKVQDWYKSLDFEDIVQDQKSLEEEVAKTPKDDTCERLIEHPLPSLPYPTDMDPAAVTHRYLRYEELLATCNRTDQLDPLLDSFLTIRQEQFIPPVEWYQHLISKLCTFGIFDGTLVDFSFRLTHSAVDFLLKEMKELNYEHSVVSYSALVLRSMLEYNPQKVEEWWQRMLDDKFEPSDALYLHKLYYYGRYTEDFDATLKTYNEIVEYANS